MNAAIFSLLNAIVLRPLPAADPQQLVQLTYTIPVDGSDNCNSFFGYRQLERFRAQSQTLSGIFGGTGLGRVNVEVYGTTGLAQGDAFTDNFFSVLGLTDWRVFGFTADVSAVSGILFGLAPAIGGARVDPGPALKEGARVDSGRARGLDGFAVMVQVTLSLVLVTGASLFTRAAKPAQCRCGLRPRKHPDVLH